MSVRLFLCGDVMTGRGIDQVLPHPVEPHLFESWARSAGAYVELWPSARPAPSAASSASTTRGAMRWPCCGTWPPMPAS